MEHEGQPLLDSLRDWALPIRHVYAGEGRPGEAQEEARQDGGSRGGTPAARAECLGTGPPS